MLFLIKANHPPSDCPSSNAKTRALAGKLNEELPEMAKKLRIKPVAEPLVAVWMHDTYVVVDSPSEKEVQELLTTSGLMQWNTVSIIPLVTLKEALKLVEPLKPLH